MSKFIVPAPKHHGDSPIGDINKTDTCTWTQGSFDIYETSCGHSFQFNDHGPIENGFKCCPYCGNKLIEEPEGSDDTD